jgi:bifunctional NMN adenylyltransferase/nudix hydrolase
MSISEYDYLIFIGRFQPFHYGHARCIEEALKRSKHVIVLAGSANSARTWRNPFTFEERAGMIQKWFDFEGVQAHLNWATQNGKRVDADTCGQSVNGRLIILPLDDYTYRDNEWIQAVQTKVDSVIRARQRGWTDYPPKVGLIGHSKDQTSYYLGIFPQWKENVDVPAFTDRHYWNATEVRDAFFSGAGDIPQNSKEFFGDPIPKTTRDFLTDFKENNPDYQKLKEEHEYVTQYKKDHEFVNAPGHEAAIQCVDAVVVQAGHILLIERDKMPGRGLWALPGGHIDPSETIKQAVLREVWEETRLKVPVKVLERNVKKFWVFDDPHRSARGRVYSNCFYIQLDPDPNGLPKVKGRSDAKKAWWEPLGNLPPEKFFEDHYHVIRKLVGGT